MDQQALKNAIAQQLAGYSELGIYPKGNTRQPTSLTYGIAPTINQLYTQSLMTGDTKPQPQNYDIAPTVNQLYTQSLMGGETGSNNTSMEDGNTSMGDVGASRSPAAITESAIKNLLNQENKNNKQYYDYGKKINEYMTKREGIAMDAKNKMDQLDMKYNNQGADIGFLLRSLEQAGINSIGKTGATQAYNASRLSEQDYKKLRDSLIKQQSNEYSGLDKTARDMYRMQMTNDMANKNLAAKMNSSKFGSTKPLSEGLAKKVGQLSTLWGNLDSIDKELGNASKWGTKITMGRLGAFSGDTKLGSIISQTSELYGRLQSGAAITKEENDRFIQSIFRAGDSPKIARYKLNLLRKYVKDMAGPIGRGRDMRDLPRFQSILEAEYGNDMKLTPDERAEVERAETKMRNFKFKIDLSKASIEEKRAAAKAKAAAEGR